MVLKYIVQDDKYHTVKEVIKSYYNVSDRLLTKLKKNKHILLNNSFSNINSIIKLGDEIQINLDFEEESSNIIPKQMALDILFEDDSLIIINKSSNMAIHPSILHFENSLSNGLKYYFNSKNIKKKIRPVNRLDKDTSGIVVFAKNEYIQESLIKQMKSHDFKKEYYAILEGFIENKKQKIIAPISRKQNSIIEREVSEKGDFAVTHLELIKNFEYNNTKLAFVKFILETGRTHQIRVHSKYINHPILGDSLYGNPSILISRQALHAYKIDFIHPITKKNMELIAPIPDDIKRIL